MPSSFERLQMEVGIVLRACLVGLLFMKHSKGVTLRQHPFVGQVFSNVGVQMCTDKCRNTARCMYFTFVTRSLTCSLYLTTIRSAKQRQQLLPIKRSERKWSHCTKRPCSYSRKCLTTRLGGSKCILPGSIFSTTFSIQRKRTSASTSVKVIRHVARSFTEDAIYGFGTKLKISMNYVKIVRNGSFEDVSLQLHTVKRSRSYACSILSMSQAPCEELTCVYVVGIAAGKRKPRLVYFKLYSSQKGAIYDNNVFLRSELSILSMAVSKNGEVYILGRKESLNLIHYNLRRQNVLIFKKEYKLAYPVLSIHLSFKNVKLSLVTTTNIRTFDVPIQLIKSPKSFKDVHVDSSKIVCLSPNELSFLQVDKNRPFRFKTVK